MRSAASLFGVSAPFDPTGRYVSSWLLPVRGLAALRLTLALYAFLVTFIDLGLVGWPADAQQFSYFTHLTYWGLAFYMLTAGLQTALFARSGNVSYPLQRWGPLAQAAHCCFYVCQLVLPPIVTITFWTILYKPPFFPRRLDQWSNISVHGLNSAYMLTELLLPATPVPAPLTILPCVVILCLYLGLAYLTFDTQGFYTYSFLDPAEGPRKRAAYICGILVASVVIWCIVSAIIWLRLKLSKGKQKGVPVRDSPEMGKV